MPPKGSGIGASPPDSPLGLFNDFQKLQFYPLEKIPLLLLLSSLL